MTFAAQETSLESGQKFELYQITIGAETFRYTSNQESITWSGVSYEATQISRTRIENAVEDAARRLTITVPLCVPGLLSAFLICFTLCLSAFVVPLILGKGKVLFISNLIYARFSQIANYPSGSAVAIIMLAVSLLTIYAVTRVVSARWGEQ